MNYLLKQLLEKRFQCVALFTSQYLIRGMSGLKSILIAMTIVENCMIITNSKKRILQACQ